MSFKTCHGNYLLVYLEKLNVSYSLVLPAVRRMMRCKSSVRCVPSSCMMFIILPSGSRLHSSEQWCYCTGKVQCKAHQPQDFTSLHHIGSGWLGMFGSRIEEGLGE